MMFCQLYLPSATHKPLGSSNLRHRQFSAEQLPNYRKQSYTRIFLVAAQIINVCSLAVRGRYCVAIDDRHSGLTVEHTSLTVTVG